MSGVIGGNVGTGEGMVRAGGAKDGPTGAKFALPK
jgi:hypothetical protein